MAVLMDRAQIMELRHFLSCQFFPEVSILHFQKSSIDGCWMTHIHQGAQQHLPL